MVISPPTTAWTRLVRQDREKTMTTSGSTGIRGPLVKYYIFKLFFMYFVLNICWTNRFNCFFLHTISIVIVCISTQRYFFNGHCGLVATTRDVSNKSFFSVDDDLIQIHIIIQKLSPKSLSLSKCVLIHLQMHGALETPVNRL